MKKHTFLSLGLALALTFGTCLGFAGCDNSSKDSDGETQNGDAAGKNDTTGDNTSDENGNGSENSGGGTGSEEENEGGNDSKEEDKGDTKPSEIVDEEEKSEGYASVSYKVKENEQYSVEAGYTPLQIFGRLNYTLKHKTDWYAVYEGDVQTILPQEITTYKQYHDGVLLSTDISTSMILNSAKEFCYIPAADRVMWRDASTTKSKDFDGFNTPWTETLTGDMAIEGADGFKEANGLPAYELSVYIFRAETVSSADEVVTNDDGTFTITYHLDPTVTTAEDGTVTGAAAYYAKQMKFSSGGMTNGADFSEITVSFTFNAQWETLKTEISEAYAAKTGFGDQSCTATGTTTYTYDTSQAPFEECNDYETFFKALLKEE